MWLLGTLGGLGACWPQSCLPVHPCTTLGPALFRCSAAGRSSHTHQTGPSHFCCCCSIHLELCTCWHSTVRKHSHFQTPPENPSVQTNLVLLYCIKRLFIFGPKGCSLSLSSRPSSSEGAPQRMLYKSVIIIIIIFCCSVIQEIKKFSALWEKFWWTSGLVVATQ